MTAPVDIDQDDDDHVAAEYVLGSLDADERASAALRLGSDTAFAGLVSAWERRLTPLS